jgi:hypothetical protein
MAKDYFQDITPPSEGDTHTPHHHAHTAHPHEEEPADEVNPIPIRVTSPESRGIRSITPTRLSRPRETREASSPGMNGMPPVRNGRSRWWMWGAAGLAVVVLIGFALFVLRPTTVTITPRSHTVVLTNATSFTAYPASSSATGTLTYSVQTADLEDSAVVPISGTTTSVAAKASGSITVYNNYSAASVKLVKTTRFATPDGLIFRTPADIIVPGKTGTTAGSVQVTVVADQTGSQYNVAPIAKFTLPGLQSNSAMFAGVYAKSSASMTGGSSGVSGPGVDPAAESAAVSQLQSNLKQKAISAAQASGTQTVLADLIQITFAQQPNTSEAGNQARIHETAHVQIPVFVAVALGQAVGTAVSADSNNSPVTLTPESGFAAQLAGSPPTLGTDLLQFTLTGQAKLIWQIDTAALTQALAGRDQGAFQTVIGTFPGIEEAHAKIEPFWNNTFPTDPSKIKVTLTAPKDSQ